YQVILSEKLFFFFQAEDGIRDLTVTGVQTCALPISEVLLESALRFFLSPRSAYVSGQAVRISPDGGDQPAVDWERPHQGRVALEIGRASCRERGEASGGDVT